MENQVVERNDNTEIVSNLLLKIGAFHFRRDPPFQWASGIQSPVYCDTRLILSFPEVRNFIKEQLTRLVKRNFIGVEALAAVATGGIPHGVLVANRVQLPFLYVRSEAKSHGKGNQVEGRVLAGRRVVLVEDLVSTGGSALNAVEALEDAGMEVLGVVGIFSYAFPEAHQRFAERDMPLRCLTDFHNLLETALERNYSIEADAPLIRRWHQDPRNWNPNS